MTTAPHETTMAMAFAKAGYQPPETLHDKLRRLMAQAIGKTGDPGAGLSGPSLKRFEALLLNEDDAELVWALFDAVRVDVVLKLFKEVLPRVKAGEDFGVRDHRRVENQRTGEPHPESDAAGEAIAAVQSIKNLPPSAAVAIHTFVPAVRQDRAHAPPGGGINGMMAVVHHQRSSWLRRFTVGNKPIASMTFAELDDAIRITDRNSRFLKLVRDSLPPYAKTGVVSDFITDEEGDKLYQRAAETHDAF